MNHTKAGKNKMVCFFFMAIANLWKKKENITCYITKIFCNSRPELLKHNKMYTNS